LIIAVGITLIGQSFYIALSAPGADFLLFA
jgi:hypothetical protein